MTINFRRAFPVSGGLLPDWSERGIIVAPMASVHPQNGYRLCELRDAGVGWEEMAAELEKHDERWSWRQMGAVTTAGETWVHTGTDAWDHASHLVGEGSVALANYMCGPEPVQAMAAALEDNRDEPMDERLLRALEAGKAAGGQGPPASGPVPEAWAMIQVFNDQQPWPAVDVRIDLDIDPVPKLRRLVTQLKRLDGLYRTMAVDPARTLDDYDVVFDIYDAQV